ncbi:MAG: AsmA-like C-terminal region-containing protein, partial [Desulfobacterales bacterium]
LAQVGSIIGQKLPPTDAFALQGYLTGSAKALSLQDFRGRARRGSLSLEVSGAVKDLPAFEGLDLSLKAGGKQLAEIGPLVGATLPELGPLDFSAHLRGSARAFSLSDLTAVVDRSDFSGRAGVEFLKRPKITLVLESSLLDMTVLLKNLKQEEKEPTPAPGGIEKRLFSNEPLPFDFLKQVDADVTLNAKNIRARDANFEFGRLILTLENGDFNIDTLKATYKQTRISGNFHLYPQSPPRVAAEFLVQDFDLGGLLRGLRISDRVRSRLDIAVDVNSRGRSLHDLMTDLDGSVGAVMGTGYLTHYLDLLSVGLTGKVIRFWGRHKEAGEIKCAAVDFDIKNGIATSRAFVFDTEAGVLTGEGDINLDTEQVHFLLVPEPRYPSLMNFWTKLRVSGPIMDPKVRPDKLALLSKGAKALSALVIGPLGLLAPFVNLGAHKAHPCSVYSIGQ